MDDDVEYWKKPIGAPSEKEAKVFAELLQPGSVLLLGCTEILLPFCDTAIDIQPVFDDPKIVRMDWLKNDKFFNNIIGDGVFNLDSDLCHGIINMASSHCRQLIVRSFNYKLDGMRYACYFPSVDDFAIPPVRSIQGKESSYFVWEFN